MLAGSMTLATSMLAAMPVAASTFPEIVITRSEAQTEWPFSVDQGELSCVNYGQGAFVFFSEILPDDVDNAPGPMKLPRMVVVSANPMALFASIEDRALYAPFDTLEALIKRLAPYETMGRELCAQQKKN